MNLIPLCSSLADLERETGRLYRRIARESAGRFPRLVELFSRLADEEAEHERMITLAGKLMGEAEKCSVSLDSPTSGNPDPGFSILEEKSRDLDAQLGYVREKQSLLSSGLPDIKESQIVVMALDIEIQLRESHTLKEIRIDDERLANLLANLVRADEAHVTLLKEWLNQNA